MTSFNPNSAQESLLVNKTVDGVVDELREKQYGVGRVEIHVQDGIIKRVKRFVEQTILLQKD